MIKFKVDKYLSNKEQWAEYKVKIKEIKLKKFKINADFV
jgi:hypothetical protein